MNARQTKTRTHPKSDRARLREETRSIRKQLGSLDYLASGSLVTRMKPCGKPNCRCANDPTARHGPYYEWGRMRDGELLERAVVNQRRAKALLAEWKHLTETDMR